MCNQFTLHHQFRIDTGKTKFEQQTDSTLSACESYDKEHEDPDTIDLEAPRLARSMHKAWRKQKNTVYWVDINLALKKIEVLSDTIEHHHSSRNTPSLMYPESCSDGNWRSHTREGICVTSTSSKDFLET